MNERSPYCDRGVEEAACTDRNLWREGAETQRAGETEMQQLTTPLPSPLPLKHPCLNN